MELVVEAARFLGIGSKLVARRGIERLGHLLLIDVPLSHIVFSMACQRTVLAGVPVERERGAVPPW